MRLVQKNKKWFILLWGVVPLILILGGIAVQHNWFYQDGSVTFSPLGTERDIVIADQEDVDTLSPLDTSSAVRKHISNLYEGLVMMDRNLTIKPALAVAFGKLDNTHWEFKLRANVQFHNGQKMIGEDVINSFTTFHTSSSESSLLDNIKNVEFTGDDTILIETYVPDVLLLQKIAKVFIFPTNNSLESLSSHPVGTGPYKLVSWEKGKRMVFEQNAYYWDKEKRTGKVTIVQDQQEIESLLSNKLIDIAIGPIVENNNQSYRFEISSLLYSNFLLYDMERSVLQDKRLRKSIFTYVTQRKKDFIEQYGKQQLALSSQFISSGVSGYNPNIVSDPENQDITFDQPLSLTLVHDTSYLQLAEWLQKILQEKNITLILHRCDGDQCLKNMQQQEADLYLLGWAFDNGDAEEFFDQVVHSRNTKQGYGLFNVTGYTNTELDRIIEACRSNFDPTKRLKDLRDINYTITKKDIFGVPLFEMLQRYAISKYIVWSPRPDGLLLFQEIHSI